MDILTITFNPTIDKSTSTEYIRPDAKLRCTPPRYQPGGGGINVSRAIKKLGGDSVCMYLAGGPSGQMLHDLMDAEGINQKVIETAENTRENFIVMDEAANQQYRFGMPGVSIQDAEWQSVLDELREMNPFPKFVVASGSLPPNVPEDIYAQIARICKEKGGKIVVDTSGPALQAALDEGVYLFKPNLGELAKLVGEDEVTFEKQEEVAKRLIAEGKAELIAVSLGPRGAMLASEHLIEYAVPPTVPRRSTVGAGDSMVAGMVLHLSQGNDMDDVIKFGVACGSAATMNEGTDLCKKEDADWIYKELKTQIDKY
jgi:6-phosphofructokinase 2